MIIATKQTILVIHISKEYIIYAYKTNLVNSPVLMVYIIRMFKIEYVLRFTMTLIYVVGQFQGAYLRLVYNLFRARK